MEIGISQRALDLANSLDIKNIQFDTLRWRFKIDINAFN